MVPRFRQNGKLNYIINVLFENECKLFEGHIQNYSKTFTAFFCPPPPPRNIGLPLIAASLGSGLRCNSLFPNVVLRGNNLCPDTHSHRAQVPYQSSRFLPPSWLLLRSCCHSSGQSRHHCCSSHLHTQSSFEIKIYTCAQYRPQRLCAVSFCTFCY